MEKQNNKPRGNAFFRLEITGEEPSRTIWSRRISRSGLIVAVVSAAAALLVGVFCLVAFTPLRTFIPGYPDARSRQQAIRNAQRVDSLETQILRWELYTENLRHVVAGEEPVRLDSLIRRLDARQAEMPAADPAADSLLRATVEQEERFAVTEVERKLPIEGIHFFSPVKGVVSRGFDAGFHPFVEVTAPAGAVVMSVLDGTVVFSGWDDEAGYMVAIQHPGDILTFYKHNQKLLRKTGEAVKAGTPVALVGGTGAKAGSDHLRFELWYRGEPADPTKYISF